MTLSQIEVFLKVAQVKSFTVAGDELNMTQSAVSHAISNLEKHLGNKLFDRSKQGVELTHKGRTVYPMFLEVHKQLHNVYMSMQTENVSPCVIKLGVLASVYTSVLPKVLKVMAELYPQIEIKVFEGNDDEITNWLIDGAIDAGFITIGDEKIESYNLLSDEWLVVCAKDNHISKKTSVTMKTLEDETFIMSYGGCEPLINKLAAQGKASLEVKFQVSNSETIIEMAREDIGISILPKLALINKKLDDIDLISLKPAQFRQIKYGTRTPMDDNLALRVLYEQIIEVSQTIPF